MDKAQRTEIINKFARKEGDTGSPEVQIALLSGRISELTEHLKANPKDHSTRRGLLAMVSLRKKLLSYLARENRAKYLEITDALGIRRGIEKVDTLEALLEQSDLVTISVHLNPQTENMIHGDLFDHFKPSAIFVNTSRGKVVNENDLYEALKAGKLRGAAFDVFATDPAPLPKDSPLLTLDNFSATPHIGGNTQEALYRTGMAVVQNVLDVLDGKPVSSMIV